MTIQMKLFLLIIYFLYNNLLMAQPDTVRSYFPNGKIMSQVVYEENIRQGDAVYYWDNGNIKEKLSYKNDKVVGTVSTYYENGNIKELYSIVDGKRDGPSTFYDSKGAVIDESIFDSGLRYGQEYLLIGEYREEDYQKLLAEWNKRQSQKNNSKEELNLPPVEEEKSDLEDDPAYYLNVEVMPEPIGGMNAIYRKLTYPLEAREKKIEGTVKILAFIEKNGEVSNAVVQEGIGYGCDENARLSVYFTRFKPGLQKGIRMKVQMVIPIEFKLNRITK